MLRLNMIELSTILEALMACRNNVPYSRDKFECGPQARAEIIRKIIEYMQSEVAEITSRLSDDQIVE